MKKKLSAQRQIHIQGARVNNLKNLDLSIKANQLTVVTGVSGSGKSSLAFDTLYAEGQRRYIETFSAYARQFLDRMDKPEVDAIDGITPAVAIGQSNPVRTSRSTVGTLTEINDYLKLIYARFAKLFCPECDTEIRAHSPESVVQELYEQLQPQTGVMICLPVTIPEQFSNEEMIQLLAQQGYTRIHKQNNQIIEVIQDRVRLTPANSLRLTEAIEAALNRGTRQVRIYPLDADKNPLKPLDFSSLNQCHSCQKSFPKATSATFSFNSPIGACPTCRGFGRVMGIDYDLVIPDKNLSLTEGAIKPFQTPSNQDVQTFLIASAKKNKIPTTIPWSKMKKGHQQWVIAGSSKDGDNQWYGVDGFFQWLERKSYKMHVRVLLSKYRSYDTCTDCQGTRLKPIANHWFIVSPANKKSTYQRHTIWQLQALSVQACLQILESLPKRRDSRSARVFDEVVKRLQYLCEVGLGYLTLDRQTRTLSGGEFQRINLTTALGTALMNTLFVLDEPSIGLHSRDVNRLIGILHRLRNAGNTLVVVEHDPQVIQAADQVVELGPKAGDHGGTLMFQGSPSSLITSSKTLTGAYLRGDKHVLENPLEQRSALDPNVKAPLESNDPLTCHPSINLYGVCAQNLKNIDVTIPLSGLVCIAGVSGSGKSTLIRQVLYPALSQKLGRPDPTRPEFSKLTGETHIADVVLVDQSPIGKSTRSVPVTVVGAFEIIRKLLSEQPLAKERGYTAGTFSFNSGNGRCPECSGNGFEIVEMQFLSDVHLKCEYCQGERFRKEIQEVRLAPPPESGLASASVSDILHLTITQACSFFSDKDELLSRLKPLLDVGLGYLQLGQSVTTLSGGEAQRLKLASHLAEAAAKKKKKRRGTTTPEPTQAPTLFLLDEPTTGLHYEDIQQLMVAFRQLILAGHALIVIEHNLEVLAAAHWIIELGPEGGEDGGQILATGTAKALTQIKRSPTGHALKDYFQQHNENKQTSSKKAATKQQIVNSGVPLRAPEHIAIHHATEHNLKNISVNIPLNQFTTITGVSGSGKSTLAFDILFAEGQRRYLESLNAYARQFIQSAGRPEVETIENIPPTVAIEQRTSRGGYRSTVATVTEIYHYLRLLYVKLGQQYCPECDEPIAPQSLNLILSHILKHYHRQSIDILAPLVVARKGIYKELAAWARQQSFSHLRVNGELTPTDPWPKLARYQEHNIELPVGQLTVSPRSEKQLSHLLAKALEHSRGTLLIIPQDKRRKPEIFSTQRACPSCHKGFESLDPRLFSYNSRIGQCQTCCGTGLEILEELDDPEDTTASPPSTCEQCDGSRLNPLARAVYFQEYPIETLASWTVDKALVWFKKLKLSNKAAQVSVEIIKAIQERLTFLQKVGLGYLELDRSAPTLSGGEAQRIRLAAQLGSNLEGVCYILDEPTIGLHARDNAKLVEILSELRDQGNTVVVVEHDETTMAAADHIIDIGPKAGKLGGQLVAQGSLAKIKKEKKSITGQYLANPLRHPIPNLRQLEARQVYEPSQLMIQGAYLNNLQQIDVRIPLHQLVCFSGVSGSGKSTIVRGTLLANLNQRISQQTKRKKTKSKATTQTWHGCDQLTGWESIDRVMEVDQTPIGKTPRSCPATYIGIWDAIRQRFAQTPEARAAGYTAARFSFNTGEGRCGTCNGQGLEKIEMNFLPDVQTTCPACQGWRFNEATLCVRYKGKHIGEVLAMDVDEAVSFFDSQPSIHRPLKLMQSVGLGYITLGQQSPTLSGGEAQRLKLVSELAKVRLETNSTNHYLYVLDEPTVGLHMADVEKLLRLLHLLVDRGHSVIVIEHNLDVVAAADWVIDVGPEGGAKGGKIIAQGTPENLLKKKRSHTAAFLREHLNV